MALFKTQALHAADATFDACYALMQATFAADELVSRAEYVLLLQTPHASTHPHWFTLLARHFEETTHKLVGMIAGSYMRLNEQGELRSVPCGMGMIEYLAIAPDQQQQGHGRALIAAFEAQMQQFAKQRGESLTWIAGEVEDDLLPFKFRLGYGLPGDLRYLQPPIEFDDAGKPCFAAVPKHLVLKPMAQPATTIAAADLRAVIQTMYRWRYVPLLGDESMKLQAAAYIEKHIAPPVLASIKAEVIPLRYTMPRDE
jgi:GNAT superfamily N-acetyltransferase